MAEHETSLDPQFVPSHDEDVEVDPIEVQLVSYLDGELPAHEVDKIERKLASDPNFHRRLLRLQRAWDMLDYLPRPEPSEAFTRSTVELVTVTLEREVTQNRRQRYGFGFMIATGLFLVAAVGLAIGFEAIRWRQESANRNLVNDLQVIENADLYRNADSITFLERLAEEGLFEND